MPATAARKAFVAEPYRWETATGVSLTVYPAADEYERETCLDTLANAATLATSLAALLAAGRRHYTLTVFKNQHRLKRGDTINYTHPQFFPAGRDFIVWSVAERVQGGERITELRLYG